MSHHSGVFAIDPGTTESAFVIYGLTGSMWNIRQFGKIKNHDMLREIDFAQSKASAVVIEEIVSYGMPVGAEVLQTVMWSGRFFEAAVRTNIAEANVSLIRRLDVKLNCCKSPKADDASIRQALIDRWGGKEKAVGSKAAPGQLYGISKDVWAALALAVTWRDLKGIP